MTIADILAEDSHVDVSRDTVYTRLVYLAEPVSLHADQAIHLDLSEHRAWQFYRSTTSWPTTNQLVPYLPAVFSRLRATMN